MRAAAAGLLFSLSRPRHNMPECDAITIWEKPQMRCSAGIALLMLAAAMQTAAAQPFPAADTLTPQQLQGRNLFNQSCMVCHVKLQITSPAKYGPGRQGRSWTGRGAVMREV